VGWCDIASGIFVHFDWRARRGFFRSSGRFRRVGRFERRSRLVAAERRPTMRQRGGLHRPAREDAQTALPIAFETQEAVLLTRAHQIENRSISSLVEVRSRVANELFQLTHVHRPARLGRGLGKNGAEQRYALGQISIARRGRGLIVAITRGIRPH
jgi:hypothetical protein